MVFHFPSCSKEFGSSSGRRCHLLRQHKLKYDRLGNARFVDEREKAESLLKLQKQQRNKRQRAAARGREELAFVRSVAAVVFVAEETSAGGSPDPSTGMVRPGTSIDVIVSDLSAGSDQRGIWDVLSSSRAEEGPNADADEPVTPITNLGPSRSAEATTSTRHVGTQSGTRYDLLLEPPGELTFDLIANVVRLIPKRSHQELFSLLADHWSQPALSGGERQRLFSLVRQCLVYEARLIHDVQRRFGSSPEDVAHLHQLMDSLSRRFVSVAHLDAFPANGSSSITSRASANWTTSNFLRVRSVRTTLDRP